MQQQNSDTNKTNKPSWILYTICIVFGLFIICFGFLPAFFSTTTGKNLLVSHLSKKLGGKLEIEKFRLSWFGKQRIDGLEFENEDSKISLESLLSNNSLWTILISKNPKRLTEIDSLYLKVPQAIKKQPARSGSSILANLTKHIRLKNATIILTEEDKPSATIQNTQLLLKEEKKDRFYLEADGYTKTAAHGGEFHVKQKFFLPKTRDIKAFLNKLEIQADAKVRNFPVKALDILYTFENPEESFLPSAILGSHINLDCVLDYKKNSIDTEIEFLSNKVKVSLNGATSSKGFSFEKTAFISLGFKPDLYNRLNAWLGLDKNLKLLDDGFMTLSSDRLFIPKVSNELQFSRSSLDTKISLSSLQFNVSSVSEVLSLNKTNLHLTTVDLAKSLGIAGMTSINYKAKTPSQSKIYLDINDIFGDKSLANIKAEITKFPVVIADQLLNSKNQLATIIGDVISLKINSEKKHSTNQYLASILSPRIHFPSITFGIEDNIYFTKPAKFLYLPNEKFTSNYLTSDYLTIEDLPSVKGQVNTFQISLDDFKKFNYKNVNFEIQSEIKSVSAKGSKYADSFRLTNFFTELEVNTLEDINFRINSLLAFEPNSLSRLLYGDSIDADFSGTINMKNINQVDIPKFKGYFKSDRLDIKFHTALKEHFKKLIFVDPLKMQLLPSPKVINDLLNPNQTKTTYVPFQPIHFTFSAKPFYINEDLFSDLQFDLDISLNQFDIVNKAWYREFSLEDTKATINGNSKKKTFEANFITHAVTDKVSAGVCKLDLKSKEFTSLDFYKKTLTGQLDLKDFSSSLIDSLFGLKEQVYNYLGNSFDFTFDFDHRPGDTDASLNVESASLTLSGDLAIDDEIKLGHKPIELSWQINNKTLDSLSSLFEVSEKKFMSLASPTILKGKIKELTWPLHHSQNFLRSLKGSSFHIAFDLEETTVESNVDQQTATLDNFEMMLTKDSEKAPVIFNMKSKVKESEKHHKQIGTISSAGKLEFDQDKKDSSTLQLQSHMETFPTLLLDSVVETFGLSQFLPSSFFGDSVTASLDVKLNDFTGTFDFNVNSQNAKAILNAYIQDGVMKLYKPLHAKLDLTPQFANKVLKSMNVSLKNSSEPVELYISEKGFYLPLRNFSLDDMQIRKGVLDLKQITCQNRGSPKDVETIFKLHYPKNRDISLWFAPSEFSLSKGILSVDRTEILFDKAFDLAVWGRVNLPKEYVNMTLGITEQALRQGFGLAGLPKNFVLQIPMSGHYGKVTVDTEIAATRIAFLIGKLSGLSKHGGAFGSIFDTLGELANDQGSVPPPKKPYPWDKNISKYLEERKLEQELNIIK